MSRTVQGILLGAGILTAIIGVLALADAGAPSHCAFQSSIWLGCILAAREGLAGGLIGAGGAIFAGWLAWTGVRRTIGCSAHRRNIAKLADWVLGGGLVMTTDDYTGAAYILIVLAP